MEMQLITYINRDILECKFASLRPAPIPLVILIETYWNVNITDEIREEIESSILIETYWNVNVNLDEYDGTSYKILIEA